MVAAVPGDLRRSRSSRSPAGSTPPTPSARRRSPGARPTRPTEYRDIAQYSAFYCMDGDFMVYDDGPERRPRRARRASSGRRSSASCSPTSSATPSRPAPACSTATCRPSSASSRPTASPARGSPTSARAAPRGITFTDEDVRSGLVAMITVRDPIGIDTLDAGGHGSAFDRVGAFQTGFAEGPGALRRARRRSRCRWCRTRSAARPIGGDGNADFGYGEGQVLGFLPDRPAGYWDGAVAAAGATMPTLTLVPGAVGRRTSRATSRRARSSPARSTARRRSRCSSTSRWRATSTAASATSSSATSSAAPTARRPRSPSAARSAARGASWPTTA